MANFIQMKFLIKEASKTDVTYAQIIVDEIASSAKVRGTGIAKRTPEYIIKKIEDGKAVMATTASGEWAGFCYIEAISMTK